MRVSRDASATLGGSDTVRVYLKNADPIVGYEVDLTYDADKLSAGESDVWWNETVFTGSPTFLKTAVADDGTIKVSLVPVSTDIIEASAEEKLIFEVILHVAEDADPGIDSIGVGGKVTVRNPDYTTETVDILTVQKGAFDVRSAFELQVMPVTGRISSTQTVTVKLTNKDDIVGAEMIIRWDSDSLSYVAGSIALNEAIWVGGAPVPEIQAGDDSVRIGLFDLTGETKIAAGFAPQQLLTLQFTADDALVDGDTASIRIEGAVTTVGADYLPVQKTAAVTNGYFAVIAIDPIPPDTVTNVQVVTGEGQISLTWQNPTDSDLDLVTLVRETVSTGAIDTIYNSKELGEFLTSLTDTGLDPDDEYYYSFQTWDISGNTMATVPRYGPYKPMTVVAPDPIVVSQDDVEVGDQLVRIRWTNPSDKPGAVISYIQVYRQAEGEADSVLVVDGRGLAVQPDSLEDTDVVSGVTYTYIFYAYDTDGQKSARASVTATPSALDSYLKVVSATGPAGTEVDVKIQVYSKVEDVAGVNFALEFDPAKVQITAAEKAADLPATFTAIIDAIDDANSAGVLKASLFDYSLQNPLPADAVTDLVVVTFMISGSAAQGEVITLSLPVTEASLSNPDAESIEMYTVGGTITVGELVPVGTDFNKDGKTDALDLYAYLESPGDYTVEQLAALIAALLEKDLPSTLLASAQDITATSGSEEGAALVSLDSNFEIIVARFTFSYDNAYTVADVQLNRSLPSSAMIVPFFRDENLVVDVINMGRGLVPAELGEELFRVLFEGASYEEAKLTLERVEVADLTGKVYGSETARISSAAVVLPKAYSLGQNSPNPFNPSTTISYELPESAGAVRVVLDVYNIRGQKVVTLVDELKDAGRYTVNWDGSDAGGRRVSSGVYFYRMRAGEFSTVRKMVILK